MRRALLSGSLVVIGITTGFQIPLFAQTGAAITPTLLPQPAAALRLSVVAGRNGANILSPGMFVPPAVDVHDSQNRPVAGAIVRFTAPADGATVTFPDGSHAYSAVTDLSGRAAVEAMQPTGVGSFLIGVSASYDEQHGEAVIPQTNYANLRSASSAGDTTAAGRVKVANASSLSRPAKIALISGSLAVVAAVGVYFRNQRT